MPLRGGGVPAGPYGGRLIVLVFPEQEEAVEEPKQQGDNDITVKKIPGERPVVRGNVKKQEDM